MEIRYEPAEEGDVLIAPEGELDISNIAELEEAIRRAESEGQRVTIDLRGLDFMDSSGLRVLVEASKRSKESGTELRLVRGNGHVQKIFEVTKLDAEFTFVDAP